MKNILHRWTLGTCLCGMLLIGFILAGCDSTGLEEAGKPGALVAADAAVPSSASLQQTLASLQVIDEAWPKQQLQDVAYQTIARALAIALKDPALRMRLKSEFEQYHTGAPEIIYKTVAGDLDIKGKKLGRLLTLAYGQKFGGRGVDVDALARELPKLHIAMPVHLESWDASNVIPLVAYAPPGVKDQEVKRIPAFDAKGRKYWLDPVAEPKQPVIVLARNERSDMDGNIIVPMARCGLDCGGGGGGGGGGTTQSTYTSGSRVEGRFEYIEKLRLHEDHERWWLEPEEIKIKIFREGNTTGDGILDDYACRRESHSGNCYQDQWDYTDKQLFGWYPSNQGYWTTFLWYEYDDGGHWVFDFGLEVQLGADPSVKGTVNIGSEQTDDDDILGYKSVNWSDNLDVEYQLTEIHWKEKQVEF